MITAGFVITSAAGALIGSAAVGAVSWLGRKVRRQDARIRELEQQVPRMLAALPKEAKK